MLGIKEGNLVEAIYSDYENLSVKLPSLLITSRSPITIYIVSMTEKTIELKVNWSDPIEQIKEMIQNLKEFKAKIYMKTKRTGEEIILNIKQKIQDKEGILPVIQILTFAGLQLYKDYNLSYYDIQEESILQLEIKSVIHVIITKTRKTLELKADTSDTVKQIKQKIQNEENIPLDQ
ncbi:hypothetical protein C1646_765207 [Rhizophagus diaphanus]|nr:hypothetical protein C1646_765207 [Rhizophagus diaphanus] [Rhizophagus sp. MUCL 43196]